MHSDRTLAPASRCPLCGGGMHDSTGGCNSCTLHSGCAMLCCERCGYTTVAPHSATLSFFKRLFHWRRRTDAQAPSRAPWTGVNTTGPADPHSPPEETRASRIPNPTEG